MVSWGFFKIAVSIVHLRSTLTGGTRVIDGSGECRNSAGNYGPSLIDGTFLMVLLAHFLPRHQACTVDSQGRPAGALPNGDAASARGCSAIELPEFK